MVSGEIPILAHCCIAISPENIRKPSGFVMFLGGMTMQHWVYGLILESKFSSEP